MYSYIFLVFNIYELFDFVLFCMLAILTAERRPTIQYRSILTVYLNQKCNLHCVPKK